MAVGIERLLLHSKLCADGRTERLDLAILLILAIEIDLTSEPKSVPMQH